MEIETLLLQADVGVEATDYIINALQSQLRQEGRQTPRSLTSNKSCEICSMDPYNKPLLLPSGKDTLNIWLITGVKLKPLPSVKLPTLLKNLATNA